MNVADRTWPTVEHGHDLTREDPGMVGVLEIAP